MDINYLPQNQQKVVEYIIYGTPHGLSKRLYDRSLRMVKRFFGIPDHTQKRYTYKMIREEYERQK